MAGQFKLPYQPPQAGTWTGFNCCFPRLFSHARASDAAVPKYINQTTVRKSDGTTIDTNVAPFPRKDATYFDGMHVSPSCASQPPGDCGSWLLNGDLGGQSAQSVTNGIDDINAATATAIDHNDYAASGTKDFRTCHQTGGKWVYGRKYWQGTQPWNHSDVCGGNPNDNALQNRYRTCSFLISSYTYSEATGDFIYDSATGLYDTWSVERIQNSKSASSSGNISIASDSGLIANSLITSEDDYLLRDMAGTGTYTLDHIMHSSGGAGWVNPSSGIAHYISGLGTVLDAQIIDVHCTTDIPMLAAIVAQWNAINSGAHSAVTYVPAISGWSVSDSYSVTTIDGITPFKTCTLSISVSRTATGYTFTASMDAWSVFVPSEYTHVTISLAGTFTLSDPYIAADCYDDLMSVFADFKLETLNLHSFRTDGAFANVPIVCFDEVGPVSPVVFIPATMDDYTTGLVNDKNGNAPGSTIDTARQHDNLGRTTGDLGFSGAVDYITTWAQRAWHDPNDYIWIFPDGSHVMPAGFTGGATLRTGLLTGKVIAHTPVGSDRHFWFGYDTWVREWVVDEGNPDGHYVWNSTHFGDFSRAPIPETALRWTNKMESQYDPAGASTVRGFFPGAWLRQKNGVVEGMKWCETKEIWPRVNFGRPCGPDKFAVDQRTVCYVVSGNAGSGFVVKPTGEASVPGTSPGLMAGNYILVGDDGIYQVAGVGNNGDGTWTISVGAQLDTIPAGTAPEMVNYLGTLRWWGGPGLCGRQVVSTADSSGTLIITFATGQPYLRNGASIDLYDVNMTLLTTAPLTLVRVNDTVFTVSTPTVTGAVWAMVHGAPPYYFYDDMAVRRTFVRCDWTFDWRTLAKESASDYSGPLTSWYGGLPGVQACNISQDSIPFDPCNPAVLCISPSGEAFANGKTYDFPATFPFDDTYGAQWQCIVETTMPDPFWQRPFKPDAGETVTWAWTEDDGSGAADTDGTHYFPHRPLVEALAYDPGTNGTQGAGAGSNEAPPPLPSGVSLQFDASINTYAPPYYQNGLPIGDNDGNFAEVDRPYIFRGLAAANIKANGRFADEYATFVKVSKFE